MKNNHLVFVYGTLRKGEGNHRLMQDATCIAEQAWTAGTLFDTRMGYPILKNETSGRVYGELYDVTEQQLTQLDRLEGYNGKGKNNFYDRILKIIETDQHSYEANVYVMTDQQSTMLHRQIENGDWKLNKLLSKDTMYYFAYGSCMDNQRFIKAGVDHHFNKVIGRGVLDGYTFKFSHKSHDGGRADILEEGGRVEGIIYEISSAAYEYLERREGVKKCLYRPTVIDIGVEHQKLVNVLTFVVINKVEEIAPPEHYMEEIIRGGTQILSESYMKSLKEKYENLLEKERV